MPQPPQKLNVSTWCLIKCNLAAHSVRAKAVLSSIRKTASMLHTSLARQAWRQPPKDPSRSPKIRSASGTRHDTFAGTRPFGIMRCKQPRLRVAKRWRYKWSPTENAEKHVEMQQTHSKGSPSFPSREAVASVLRSGPATTSAGNRPANATEVSDNIVDIYNKIQVFWGKDGPLWKLILHLYKNPYSSFFDEIQWLPEGFELWAVVVRWTTVKPETYRL